MIGEKPIQDHETGGIVDQRDADPTGERRRIRREPQFCHPALHPRSGQHSLEHCGGNTDPKGQEQSLDNHLLTDLAMLKEGGGAA